MRALCRPADALFGFHQHISNDYLTHALETLPRLIGKPRAFALGCQRSNGLGYRPRRKENDCEVPKADPVSFSILLR
jgi:hypothetical protein